jgi:hypothetical protein
MTPQEIVDYKTKWLKNAHLVTVNTDLDWEGKAWCRRHLERHQWSFTSYTDMYEHTFYFEAEQAAKQFEEWLDERTLRRNT